MILINKYYNLILLLILVLISHFIPLERSSFAPDFYVLSSKQYLGLANFFYYPDRPLLYLWLEFQYAFFKDNKISYFMLLIFVNIINTFCIYLFYNIFF